MKNAFSLIELMVVIAIVAVLAAIAVPAYKTYVSKAKLSSAVLFVDGAVDSSIRYYNAHGKFASVEQLGLPLDPEAPSYALISSAGGAVGNMSLGDNANDAFYDPADCRHGSALASIVADVPAGEDNPTDFDLVVLFKYFIDVDGVIIKRCHYSIGRIVDGNFGAATPLSGNYIANCVNTNDNPTYDEETTNIIETGCL